MNPGNLAFLDTETTGLNPLIHEVIDIHVILCQLPNLEIVGDAGGLVKPDWIELADPKALEVNGFDEARWAQNARPWPEVWKKVRPLLERGLIVGQNPSFDIAFINAMGERYDTIRLRPFRTIDTKTLALPLRQNGVLKKLSLDSLCQHFGIDIEGAHSAKADCYRTLEVYRRLTFPHPIKSNDETKS